jgi:hypothetical protein
VKADVVLKEIRMVTRVIILAVAVASSIYIGFYIGNMYRWNSFGYDFVLLDEDLILESDPGKIVGYIKKGYAFYAPSKQDMGMSDPGDGALHKVFVRIPSRNVNHEYFPKKYSGSIEQRHYLSEARIPTEKERKILEQLNALDKK